MDGEHMPDDWSNQGTLVVFNLDATVDNEQLQTAFAEFGNNCLLFYT